MTATYMTSQRFSRILLKALHESGYVALQGSGSARADIIAFGPHGTILVIAAAHVGNSKFNADVWDRLYDIASWSSRAVVTPRIGRDTTEVPVLFFQPVTPILAYLDESGHLAMDELTGERMVRRPEENRRPFDWRCACTPPHPDLSLEDLIFR